jgi:SAM-dependent methyltransferase
MSKAAATVMSEHHVFTAPGLGGDRSIDLNEHPHRRWLAAVKALRDHRPVSDGDWDLAYPWKFGELSKIHWSPISVVRRAAALLSRGSKTRILDVGSGVGKFCTVAALTTAGTFCGIERWGEMVDMARLTACRARVSTTRFIHARVEDVDWMNFDGFYLFNPFAELRWPDLGAPEAEAGESPDYDRLIKFTQETLDRARSGTRVVTYHGFGGTMPRSYRSVFKEVMGTDFLELWVK